MTSHGDIVTKTVFSEKYELQPKKTSTI